MSLVNSSLLRQRDPSLTLKGDNFAYFMLNDSEIQFFTVKYAMGEKLISRSIG